MLYEKLKLDFQYKFEETDEHQKFYFIYDETEFRHLISNIDTGLTIADIKDVVNDIFKDIEKKIVKTNKLKNSELIKKLHINYKINYYKNIQYYLQESKKDLLSKFIKSYYSSWLVLDAM